MRVARQRRHTLYFLSRVRRFAPVFLDTEIDMSSVRAHRIAARADGVRYSTVSYVLHAAGRALAAHPQANAAIRGRINPKVARFDGVDGKLALDKILAGQRVVLAAVVNDLHVKTLAEIQREVDRYRDGDPAEMTEFAPVRALHRLPWLLGSAAFGAAMGPLRSRAKLMGTFAVSSLGHRPVDGFYSVGGTTITLGVGHIRDRAVVRDGQVGVAPVMRLSLTFDHRVIDGAEAADLLADIRSALENFAASPEAAGRPRDLVAAAGEK